MSDPGWSTYRPDTTHSEGERAPVTPGAVEQRGSGFAIGIVVVIIVVIVGAAIAVGMVSSDGGSGGSDTGDAEMAVLEDDFLADSLAEAAEIETGDPFEVRVTEYGVMLSYFDDKRGEQRDLSFDVDSTADYRIRATSDLEPNFAPTTFPIGNLDAAVLLDLSEQAMAEAGDPDYFSLSVEVPHQAQQPQVTVRVGDSGDGVRLMADLDGGNATIE